LKNMLVPRLECLPLLSLIEILANLLLIRLHSLLTFSSSLTISSAITNLLITWKQRKSRKRKLNVLVKFIINYRYK
jgi:hypothetical protein